MSDTISRQAAIDSLSNMMDTDGFRDGWAVSRANVKSMLMALPPAQLETPYCDYCHEDSDGFTKAVEKNGHAVIRGEWLYLKADRWRGKVKIKYCPMCGRRLER